MTESFDDALVTVHKHRLLSGKMCNRLQRAHDHEMEQLRRSRFREGYEAGQRSMDAEHQAVASKVMQVPYDDDAMEFLFHISAIICGGYYTSNKLLRDELVRLLGGVHEPEQTAASGCACDADCDCHNQQPQAVAMYDELDNERHKAICELRKMPECYPWHQCTEDASPCKLFVEHLYDAIGLEGIKSFGTCLDRLIHLLGGDEPAESLIETLVKSTEEMSRQGKVRFPPNADGSLEGLKTVEETAALIEDVRRRADQSHESSPTSLENETGITDELREFVGTFTKRLSISAAEVNAIADRIDEQFNRICWQQESVLQHTIDEMVEERDKLQAKLDKLEKFDPDTSLATFGDDNEELRKLLSRASKLLANAEQDRDTYYAYWMDCKEKVVHGNATIDELEAKLDKVMKEANRHRWEYCETCEVSKTCDNLRKSLREIAERAGVPYKSDLSEYNDDELAENTLAAIDSKNEHIGALEWQRDRQRKLLDEYERRDTVESIVRDIHLGKVTDTQAIRRIEALHE